MKSLGNCWDQGQVKECDSDYDSDNEGVKVRPKNDSFQFDMWYLPRNDKFPETVTKNG